MEKSFINEKKLDSKKYLFMHKDIEVCRMDISYDGTLSDIEINTSNIEHFPFGTGNDIFKFKKWWKDRAVPQTRHEAKFALRKLGYISTGNMLVDNLALSLNDCYWIKPSSSNIKWKDVNLF